VISCRRGCLTNVIGESSMSSNRARDKYAQIRADESD
jgi:hypothetical protein